MNVGIDTNILAYAEGVNGGDMQRAALSVIKSIPAADVVIPVQVLAELYRVLVIRAKLPRALAEHAVMQWTSFHVVEDVTLHRFRSAAVLATKHQLTIFDAIILATAADSNCRLLLSEDMHSGFVWQGCKVMNPFSAEFATLRSQQFPQS